MINTHDTVKNREHIYIQAIAAEMIRIGCLCEISENSDSILINIDNSMSLCVRARIRHSVVQIVMSICSPSIPESVIATETCLDGVYSISPECIVNEIARNITEYKMEGARVADCKKMLSEVCAAAGMSKTMDAATVLAFSLRGFTVAFSFSDKNICHMESIDSRKKDIQCISISLGFPYSEVNSICDVVRGLVGVIMASRCG